MKDSFDNPTESRPPIEVPSDSLSSTALNAVIESFILREGTDYGAVEISLEAKIRQVRTQIEKGEVLVVFDVDSETVTLMNRQIGSRAKE